MRIDALFVGKSRQKSAVSGRNWGAMATAWEFCEFLDVTDAAAAPPPGLPNERQKPVEFGRALKQGRRMILLIEHDMPLVMDASDRIVVADFRRRITEGRPDTIQNNSAEIDAYLGADAD